MHRMKWATAPAERDETGRRHTIYVCPMSESKKCSATKFYLASKKFPFSLVFHFAPLQS